MASSEMYERREMMKAEPPQLVTSLSRGVSCKGYTCFTLEHHTASKFYLSLFSSLSTRPTHTHAHAKQKQYLKQHQQRQQHVQQRQLVLHVHHIFLLQLKQLCERPKDRYIVFSADIE